MQRKTKKGLTRFVVLFLGMFILFLFLVKRGFKATEVDFEYYRQTNLKFNGTIEKIKPLTSYGHDFGIIFIDIYDSNYERYDPRDKLDRFLGVVKDGKIDLVFNEISEVQVGDSIAFKVQEFKIHRNGKLIRESISGMPPDDLFDPFNEVNEKIEL